MAPARYLSFKVPIKLNQLRQAATPSTSYSQPAMSRRSSSPAHVFVLVALTRRRSCICVDNDALSSEDIHMRSSASDDETSELVGDEELFPGSTSGSAGGGDVPRSNLAAMSGSTPHRPLGINGMTPPDSQHGPSNRAAPPSMMRSSPPMTGSRRTAAPTTTATAAEDISMEPVFPSAAQAQQSAVEGSRRVPLARRADDEEPPGHVWMNKHARDAFVRGMDSLVDDGFSLSESTLDYDHARPRFEAPRLTRMSTGEFGDPFDESDMMRRGGHR